MLDYVPPCLQKVICTIYIPTHMDTHRVTGINPATGRLYDWVLRQRESMLLTRSLSVGWLYVGRHKASLKYIQSLCCFSGWERCSIKMSLQQGCLHPLACISLALSSPMPGQHNGSLLYNRCGLFPTILSKVRA